MSKIIKAFQLTPIKSFDFREIEQEEVTYCEADARVSETDRLRNDYDSSVAVESVIQRRLDEAERQARELEKQGYEEGYARGWKEGNEAGRQAMHDTRERLESLLQELQELPAKVFQDYRGWFIDAVLAVSRQIVGDELSARPELLVDSIESLIMEAEKSATLTVYLNPNDLETLEKHSDHVARLKDLAAPLLLKPDAALLKGGCRVESEIQLLDATIETQLEGVRRILTNNGAATKNRAVDDVPS